MRCQLCSGQLPLGTPAIDAIHPAGNLGWTGLVSLQPVSWPLPGENSLLIAQVIIIVTVPALFSYQTSERRDWRSRGEDSLGTGRNYAVLFPALLLP